MISISKQTAKAFLHQQLIKPQFTESKALLNHLEAIQLDPVAVIERNHHLTASLRMPVYQHAHLETLLQERQAFEYFAQAACLLPIEDYHLFADVRHRLQNDLAADLAQYKPIIKTILTRLANEGPLSSNAFVSDKKVQGGWDKGVNTTKETSHALQLLFYAGHIQVTNRDGATRYFSRTEDAISKTLRIQEQDMSTEERAAALQFKYARAYRLFSSDDPRYGWQKHAASVRKQLHQSALKNGQFTEVSIEGIKRSYAILTEDSEALLASKHHDPHGIYLLSPLDPLLWRRERINDVYEFHYRWEIYVPQSKRLIGPYGMPILWDGDIIGQISPYYNRVEQSLIIENIVLNERFDKSKSNIKRMHQALEKLAERIGAASVVWLPRCHLSLKK